LIVNLACFAKSDFQIRLAKTQQQPGVIVALLQNVILGMCASQLKQEELKLVKRLDHKHPEGHVLQEHVGRDTIAELKTVRVRQRRRIA
jgi:hypothetical protein